MLMAAGLGYGSHKLAASSLHVYTQGKRAVADSDSDRGATDNTLSHGSTRRHRLTGDVQTDYHPVWAVPKEKSDSS
ncbi:hypothetical protein F2P81_007243 [Scophthalmus maximus]|uniref:Uncharacterized protein n=1 Tax=Scophthalmus maximus TaxID=52904 RepID=A0A6A4T845_SCOMX|nr:hypothetical protein F2P81_007243 [Scophthalmus maximus]